MTNLRLKSSPKNLQWVCRGGPWDDVKVSSKFEGPMTIEFIPRAKRGGKVLPDRRKITHSGEPLDQIVLMDHNGAYLLQWREDGKHEYIWKTLVELGTGGAPLAVNETPSGCGGSSPSSTTMSAVERMRAALGR